MIKEIIQQWEENKYLLENYFRTTESEEITYESIVRKIFELCIEGYNLDKLIIIDDGSYEGEQTFILPKDTSSPSIEDYIITHNYYGSCPGCDTLEGIKINDNIEEQIKDYMQLALHLVQKISPLKPKEED